MRPLRILNYAVNGVGVGHVTRLLAVNRWMRRLADALNRSVEIFFITTSEAEGMLYREGIPSYKLPSHVALNKMGVTYDESADIAREMIWTLLERLAPDLLVVDTFPSGTFFELRPTAVVDALALCRASGLIYRPVKDDLASSAEFQATVARYQRVVVPEYAAKSAAVAMPGARYIGPVMSRESEEIMDRAAARAALGIGGAATVIYVSTGGGGYEPAEDRIHAVCSALARLPNTHVVVGAGPLYRGQPIAEPNLQWLTRPGMMELMPAFDVAVTAAGYNTFNELMFVGIPSVFLPMGSRTDDQGERARRAQDVGAGILLESDAFDEAALVAAVQTLSEPSTRAKASAAARMLVPTNHARDAAVNLLDLLIDRSQIDAALTRIVLTRA